MRSPIGITHWRDQHPGDRPRVRRAQRDRPRDLHGGRGRARRCADRTPHGVSGGDPAIRALALGAPSAPRGCTRRGSGPSALPGCSPASSRWSRSASRAQCIAWAWSAAPAAWCAGCRCRAARRRRGAAPRRWPRGPAELEALIDLLGELAGALAPAGAGGGELPVARRRRGRTRHLFGELVEAGTS